MTKQTTTSKDDASNVSANTESPDQKSEQTGTTCMHEPKDRGIRGYKRDDKIIAEREVCCKCGKLYRFLWGRKALRDWTENAD